MSTLRNQYNKASKKEKTQILDEYCARTGEDRKYAIKKFRYKVKTKNPDERKRRPQTYQGDTIAVLAEMWHLFDRPCGQRLQMLLQRETDRLREAGEIRCSDTVAAQLKALSPATIDRRLRHEKQVYAHNLKHSKRKNTPLLSAVPVKTAAEMDRAAAGDTQIDCVEHCGTSAAGEYIHSLTTVDVATGWWEGAALMGKSQQAAFRGIRQCRERSPVPWRELHPDNGDNILNWHVYRYTKDADIAVSRSRPYKKNDNCFAEQKNSTHVRKPFGYLRFDTPEEQEIMDDLYQGDLRLYKNFFQPVMKLTEKVRVAGKQHRRYDRPKTPYERVLESGQVSNERKRELQAVYAELNPAALKRSIETKVKELYQVYRNKKGSPGVGADTTLTPSTVSYHLIHQV